MQIIQSDVVIIGGGGAGLRAAIAACERDSRLRVALVSKVVPMRSHTVAAEGGAAGVTRSDDSLQYHFDDTVSGGDWLCDQSAVEYFVAHAHEELVRLEHWGCPWGRQPDGKVNVRYFGGMKMPRTWYAADRSGFHILHTLFQTSHKYPAIKRYDEYFCVELLVDDGSLRGVLAIEIATGEFVVFEAPSVVLATGGAGRVFRQNTNAGTVTGDGMGLAYRAGVPLRDMEFMQYHPTCLPGTGILMTEACRGEGAILTNKDGYRYLQDYGLGPLDPWPRPKAMELGPRDRLSQAFWHEHKKGRTYETPGGPAVNLDLRHLGAKRIHERLPLIAEAAKTFSGIDAVREPIPVCPAVHYTMGGILTNVRCETSLPGLYAAGECASVGIHGANRLGSNSLTELVVFGRVAGEQAAQFALAAPRRGGSVLRHAQPLADALLGMLSVQEGERLAAVRDEMRLSMEKGAGIYRTKEDLEETCRKLAELRGRYAKGIRLDDRGRAFNTEWLTAIELGNMLEVAQTVAHSALERRESRGSHQRLDYDKRDDVNFLKHSLACWRGEDVPRIDYMPVTITKSSPRARVYGGEGKQVVLT
jgi:fumarate reductase flavoprotein subunit